MDLDKTDERILKNLMVDARSSARQLALKLGMSTVTVLSRIFITVIQNVSGQSDDVGKKLQMELIVTDEQKIILFASFAIAVIGLFAYLARDIILRKKTLYDSTEFDSKNDKTYEKYHSDWSDDYE